MIVLKRVIYSISVFSSRTVILAELFASVIIKYGEVEKHVRSSIRAYDNENEIEARIRSEKEERAQQSAQREQKNKKKVREKQTNMQPVLFYTQADIVKADEMMEELLKEEDKQQVAHKHRRRRKHTSQSLTTVVILEEWDYSISFLRIIA
jgi:hypothetical protein